MTDKPFRILGLQQIAIGGPDKQKLKNLWVDVLGLRVTSTFVSERENVDEDICALGHGPTAVEVDLMQPIDPDKKPAVHATPLNHVGLWVDDLVLALAEIHGADVSSPGIAPFVRSGNYLERQLRRFSSLWEMSATRDIEDSPPRLLNGFLHAVSAAEVRLGAVVRWPVGSSLVAVAEKL